MRGDLRWTHAVDQRKTAIIRERNMATIEIQLSRSLRDVAPEDLRRAIQADVLRDAGRAWLHHPGRKAAMDALRREYVARIKREREEAEARARAEEAREREASARARHAYVAGLISQIGQFMAVDYQLWLKTPLAALGNHSPDAVITWGVCDHLTEALNGILIWLRAGASLPPPREWMGLPIDDVIKDALAKQRADRFQQVDALLRTIATQIGVNLAWWYSTACPVPDVGLEKPNDLIDAGGAPFTSMVNCLVDLASWIRSPDGVPVPDDWLGLPLEDVVKAVLARPRLERQAQIDDLLRSIEQQARIRLDWWCARPCMLPYTGEVIPADLIETGGAEFTALAKHLDDLAKWTKGAYWLTGEKGVAPKSDWLGMPLHAVAGKRGDWTPAKAA
jgi:hypothetical protein